MTGAYPEPPPFGAPQPYGQQPPPVTPYAPGVSGDGGFPPPAQPGVQYGAPQPPPGESFPPPGQAGFAHGAPQPPPGESIPPPAQTGFAYGAPQPPPVQGGSGYPGVGGYPAPPYLGGGQPPAQKSNRGVIIAVSIVGVLGLMCVLGIVSIFYLVDQEHQAQSPDTAGEISGLIDYRTTHPEWLEREHLADTEKPQYQMVPAAGGRHYGNWQRCLGDVYAEPVSEGRAVHSLEHGAVWITYQPSLAKSDVDKLAAKVRNNDFMLMSPYDGQPSAISLQAWGYQLRVDKADDPRVDQFIKKYRETASLEPGTPCSNGLAD
ncbi:DUF3105 domain-containing protein [Dactylosporangium sp. NPDC051541]|uniref:DUF3105 domain-containing protein n=1 Tax=Dactylosporangium sp. NPDC051541 TaxID=3363977 RepID=UPI00379706D2